MKPIELLGGLPRLRAIVDDFIDRVAKDVMIGFFFDGVDLEVLKQREFSFAAQNLGSSVRYSGRPLREVHRTRKIFDGQFDRRLQILREVLDAHHVPQAVRDPWLDHSERLRPAITRGECLTGLE